MRRIVLLAAITLLVSPRGMHGIQNVTCKYLIGAMPHQIAYIHPCTDSKMHRRNFI